MAWLPCYVRVCMPMNSATRQDQRDCAAENAVCRNMLQPETALTASFERLEQSIDIKLGSVVHFCEEPVWTGGIRVKLVAVHVLDLDPPKNVKEFDAANGGKKIDADGS